MFGRLPCTKIWLRDSKIGTLAITVISCLYADCWIFVSLFLELDLFHLFLLLPISSLANSSCLGFYLLMNGLPPISTGQEFIGLPLHTNMLHARFELVPELSKSAVLWVYYSSSFALDSGTAVYSRAPCSHTFTTTGNWWLAIYI